MKNLGLYNDIRRRAYEFAKNYNKKHNTLLKSLFDFSQRSQLHFYEERDKEIIDYQMFNLKGDTKTFRLRGPAPASLEKNEYITCIGAAQTLGVYCEKPFTSILSNKLNCPILNLADGGAGPAYYLQDKKILQYINNSKFAVIQVMSARAERNSLVDYSFDKGKMMLMVLTRKSDGKKILAGDFYDELIKKEDKESIKAIVAEIRANWLASYKSLFSQIKVPIILLWFSKRKPDYSEGYKNTYQLFGGFPQLVNEEMINELKPEVQEYVKCITDRGLPQPLTNLTAGKDPIIYTKNGAKIITHNAYYPSPEMHEDAVALLEPVCKKYLEKITAPKIVLKRKSERGRFIIFTFPRTGSSTLRKLFDLHPKLSCVHEPFNKDLMHVRNFSKCKYGPEVIDSPERLKFVLDNIFESHNIIKHLNVQLSPELNEELLKYPNCKVIFLWRKNLLQRLISNIISTKAQYWHTDTSVLLKKKFEPIPAKKIQRRIQSDLEELNKWKEYIEKHVKDYYELTYEGIYGLDLNEDQKIDKLNELYNYLGVDPLENEKLSQKAKDLLNPKKTKLNSEHTYRLIPNIQKIEKMVGSEKTGYLFSR